MQRHRQICAAPRRAASETWSAITTLVVGTLERSRAIAAADVSAVMEFAAPAGRMLIAGGHLDRHPLVVAAAPVDLSITTVSGTGALTEEENLAPVPGGTSATGWMIYLPAPDPLASVVRSMVVSSAHLSAGQPPDGATAKSAVMTGTPGLVDLAALARREAGR
jgi:hypothetical protein